MSISKSTKLNFDNWQDGLLSIGLDGTIVRINKAAEELLGWASQSLEGKLAHDVLCKHSVYSDHELSECPLVVSDQPLIAPVECYWMHKNGENLAVSYRRMYDDDSGILIAFTSCERQGYQVEELKKLALFTEVNPAPLLELDSQGLILFSNPAMTDLMLEYGFNEEGSPSILPDNLSDLVNQAINKGGIDNVESFAQSDEDPDCFCYFLWQFLLNDSAQGKTVLLSGLDVTSKKIVEQQREQYERELELEKEKTRKEYLAMMVHELRSPLNAVVGYANVLKLKLKGKITDAQLMLFDKIIEGGNQLAEQISETLESSKVEAAELSADIATFDAAPVIRKVCSELESTAQAKRLDLIVKVDDQAIYMKADAQHFRQIAINLISNAVKYTARGKVTVTLSGVDDPETGQSVSLSVKDTGCGIPDSQKDSIFKLYQRQDGHVNSDIEGDGYGLAIVGEMVEINQAKILLSTRVGVGSTFTVLFPV